MLLWSEFSLARPVLRIHSTTENFAPTPEAPHTPEPPLELQGALDIVTLVAKEARVARQTLNQARKQLHRAGIEARKEERAQKKMIAKLYEEGLPIPPEFEEPIPDPEAPQIESQYESERGSEWE
ncbi:hypothetical protein VC83_06126 [Pseudogymnoascus destructans]|uniref:Uncharacterized protein n=1 Tax=Pseudogymnoascus destructans TaxID=655981 RepID=A0A177AAH5_9PEZI|nr:uncharacterized protein VC83_06126 [Pseudogymnoascus destructans]OAF58760.1 hypothetical protein VC83_06126 [Pseudogymnoascus destructans]